MWVHVLGSAAGGGFPQWNCNCPNCRAVRDGSLPCQARTQSSIAVSADYRHWFLFNASPDIRAQLNAFPALWPQNHKRHTPLEGIVLSDAEMDHTLGLLMLRETQLWHIYATPWVYTALHEWNRLLRTLEKYCTVEWHPVRFQQPAPLPLADGTPSGLTFEAFPTRNSKVVTFAAQEAPHPEASAGYRVTDTRTGHTLVYLPAVQDWSGVRNNVSDCSCLLIDGTCWYDDELARLGISSKTARAMGHLPIAGEGGSLELLADLDIDRIVYIHINNTNPILIENSPQRQLVEAHGLEVAFDGMEMEI